jgi:bifunctional DNA-binding transcriptional regulator/antitoxin component of YhaV-PrlF toxin-antitoxin module
MTRATKGQITIPQDIRLKLGPIPGTHVAFDVVGESVCIRKRAEHGRGAALVAP